MLVRFSFFFQRRYVVVKKDEKFDFEKALKELEKLVENMEEGDMSLEDSMKQFERGVALTRSCQKALADAEQKVQILLQNAGKDELVAFKDNDNNE
ncbi:MAG: exodeoxyribonuclease VII small subunit [Gammaproteobacteria bacterium]|nr:exodeoxyribonuclease VII small subunit [Gammaproteobacteria bacterium]